MIARTLLLASALTLGAFTLPAQAEVSLSIAIGVPPPPVLVEVVPRPRHGYVWAPGYWHWDHHRGHHWVEGRWLIARAGYYWIADRWDHVDYGHYRFEPGRWERAPHRVEYRYEQRHYDHYNWAHDGRGKHHMRGHRDHHGHGKHRGHRDRD